MSGVPSVSVIVPYFNAESYLSGCLDSLVAQTLEDLQIVLVDDGSTDGSAQVAQSYAQLHPDTFVLASKANGGRADARNAGLALATGAYIGFVDSDDTVEPQIFAELLGRATASGADLVVCDYDVTTPASDVPTVVHEGDASEYGRSLAENPRLFTLCLGSLCNKLFARGLFGDEQEFFPTGVDFEDLATVYVLLARAHKIERVDGPPLYHYAQGTPHSIMSACDERFLQLVDALGVLDSAFREMGRFEEFSAQLLRVNLEHSIFQRYSDLFRAAPAFLRSAFIDRAFAHLDADFPGWRRRDIAAMFATNSVYAFVSTHKPLLKAYASYLAGQRATATSAERGA